MTKHPDNPYWCHQRDKPYSLTSADQWDKAQREGYLTTEHILDRLTNMLEHALGNGADHGIGEDGFLTALVATGYRLDAGVKVRVWSRDHPPPHVHVEIKGEPRLHLRINIETGEFLPGDHQPPGLGTKIKLAQEFIVKHKDDLMKLWLKTTCAAPGS